MLGPGRGGSVRLVRERLGGRRSLIFDLVVAAALEAVGQFEIFWPGPERVIAFPAYSSVLWLVAVTPVPWRRRAPWALFSAASACLLAEDLPAPTSGTIAGFVLLCVAVYGVARYDGRLEWIVGASGVAMGVLVVHYSRDPRASSSVEGIQASYLVLLASPVIGRLVRDRVTRASELEVRVAEHPRLQQETALAAVRGERARIARELHDVIAHSVSVVIIQSVAVLGDLDDGRVIEARSRVAAMEETARQALADMRRLVAIGDAPPDGELGPQPGLGALPGLIDQLRSVGLEARLSCFGDQFPLAAGADLALFRVAQEALTNAVNHAPGASVTVTVTYSAHDIEVAIVNGPPAVPDPGPGGGRGLVGMHERIALYGGTLATGGSSDGGFAVRVSVPVDRVVV
jgi:signal transduction histidine kinase